MINNFIFFSYLNIKKMSNNNNKKNHKKIYFIPLKSILSMIQLIQITEINFNHLSRERVRKNFFLKIIFFF